jgi:hypothetical protein
MNVTIVQGTWMESVYSFIFQFEYFVSRFLVHTITKQSNAVCHYIFIYMRKTFVLILTQAIFSS